MTVGDGIGFMLAVLMAFLMAVVGGMIGVLLWAAGYAPWHAFIFGAFAMPVFVAAVFTIWYLWDNRRR